MHGSGEAEPAAPPITSVEQAKAIRSTHGIKTASAHRLEGNPELKTDGKLDDSVWAHASINLGFLQREPAEGKPSTERTEFRVLYDRNVLYFRIICYDSEPEKISATERQRDKPMDNDDTVTIALDTFHDHRNFFVFRTNGLGNQYDALVTDEGRDINRGWDEKWEVHSQILSKVGWSAEFAIPFKSLRVVGNDSQVWGLEVERVIRRKNEFTYWTNFKRGYKFESISQAGHLRGLEGFDPGFRLRIKPFAEEGFKRSANKSSSALQNAGDGGLQLLKFRVTPGLMADFTANSNFLETDPDTQQVNLDRWELFYPEKREFFQEAGIFKFGVAQGEMPAPDVSLFHTRRIGYFAKREGLATQNIPVPILEGARLTGKLAGFGLGLLDVQTGALPSQGVPQSNFGVVRVKRDILGRSSVGGFFLNREIAGTKDYSRVYGMDSNFIFHEHLFANALYARSIDPATGKSDWTSSGGLKWDSDFFDAGMEYLLLGPDFRDDLGFVPRPNQRRYSPMFDLKPRPERLSRVIRRLQAGFRMDYVTDKDGRLLTRYEHYNFQIYFQSGDHILIAPHSRFEQVDAPFEMRRGVTIPSGSYPSKNIRLQYDMNPARTISGVFVFQPQWGFFGGDLYTLQVRPRLKMSSKLTLEPGYVMNQGSFKQGKFTDHLSIVGINYAFTNQWLTSTLIQYNNVDNKLAAQFRLNYIFRPGDSFYLVYNLGKAMAGTRNNQTDQILAAKLTYSFDF